MAFCKVDFSLESEVDGSALAEFASFDVFRRFDLATIKSFVADHSCFLDGAVLDFGAGRPGTCRAPSPYRDLIRGRYCAADIADVGDGDPNREETLHSFLLESRPFDAILCTQVLHYMDDGGARQLRRFHELLRPGGRLVLTYATTWPEVELSDSLRCTKAHMERLLERAGFSVEVHRERYRIRTHSFVVPFGYGVVAVRGAGAEFSTQ